jgi:hypothetical protein
MFRTGNTLEILSTEIALSDWCPSRIPKYSLKSRFVEFRRFWKL